MKSIPQKGRSFNAPTLPFVGTTASHDVVAPYGSPVSVVPLQVDSRITLMGNRSHIVTTSERNLAYALYEQALEVDIEPEFAQSKGVWTIGFICNDSERDNALNLAVGVTA